MKDTEAALEWITALLSSHSIPFRISGGFAARLYGAKRELADIDIELSEEYYDVLMPEIQPYIIWGPGFYTDENWKLNLITLKYAGQEIDLAGIAGTEIFDQDTKEWAHLEINLSTNEIIAFGNLFLPIIPRDELLAYKRKLQRFVDNADVQEIG